VKWPYRVAKTHRMPYLYRSFLQKSPIFSGSFAEIHLQLKASYGSSPPCTTAPTSSGCRTSVCVCACMHVCVCARTRVGVYECVCVQQLYLSTYIICVPHACVCVSVCVCVCVCACVCVHVSVCVRVCAAALPQALSLFARHMPA